MHNHSVQHMHLLQVKYLVVHYKKHESITKKFPKAKNQLRLKMWKLSKKRQFSEEVDHHVQCCLETLHYTQGSPYHWRVVCWFSLPKSNQKHKSGYQCVLGGDNRNWSSIYRIGNNGWKVKGLNIHCRLAVHYLTGWFLIEIWSTEEVMVERSLPTGVKIYRLSD